MSKISQLHAELTEQAAQLGFESIEEAEQHGWIVNYESGMLEPPVVQPELDEIEELDKAHEAWLKERKEVLGGLVNLMVHSVYDYDTIIKAYNFIKEQCHD